jgi:hypothetical protein
MKHIALLWLICSFGKSIDENETKFMRTALD